VANIRKKIQSTMIFRQKVVFLQQKSDNNEIIQVIGSGRRCFDLSQLCHAEEL
jgi:hypothetical protein